MSENSTLSTGVQAIPDLPVFVEEKVNAKNSESDVNLSDDPAIMITRRKKVKENVIRHFILSNI